MLRNSRNGCAIYALGKRKKERQGELDIVYHRVEGIKFPARFMSLF